MVITRASILAVLLGASFGASSLFASPLAADETPAAEEPPAPAPASPAVREIEIVVDGGYRPSRIVIQEGERVRLKLIRKDYSPCTREIVFASLGIRRELPTNTPVTIDIPAQSAGEIPFSCGMNMVKGVIVVEPRK
jgi:plastocyanin domain-containing protein